VNNGARSPTAISFDCTGELSPAFVLVARNIVKTARRKIQNVGDGFMGRKIFLPEIRVF
jgi:hypothetical protein